MNIKPQYGCSCLIHESSLHFSVLLSVLFRIPTSCKLPFMRIEALEKLTIPIKYFFPFTIYIVNN